MSMQRKVHASSMVKVRQVRECLQTKTRGIIIIGGDSNQTDSNI
jgi:hypothetical protein